MTTALRLASPDVAAAVGTSDPAFVRLRVGLGYDGTDFSGWAVQPERRTVAGELTAALATVLRVEPGELGLVVAGRTDAGVHARGQVCHVDVPAGTLLEPEQLCRRLAGVLPPDIRVRAVTWAAAGFDARFSALRRHYAYRVSAAAWGAPPLRRHDVLAVRGPLDVPAMDAAARSLVGLHDFAAFCRRREGATTVRTLLSYRWGLEPSEDGDLLVARVSADAFCHSMVRALVGCALAVGQGRREIGWAATVLAAGVRDPMVVVVPPHGLVLEQVDYPPDADLATRATQARAVRT